jgi:hypothetical protein
MQLRDILEEMARNGELQEFTGRPRGQENQRPRENLPQERQQGHQQNQASPVLFIAGVSDLKKRVARGDRRLKYYKLAKPEVAQDQYNLLMTSLCQGEGLPAMH